MGQTALEGAVQAVSRLTEDELREVEEVVRRLLSPGEAERGPDDLYAALLKSGTISRVPSRTATDESSRPLVRISGKPLSETVIEDRR